MQNNKICMYMCKYYLNFKIYKILTFYYHCQIIVATVIHHFFDCSFLHKILSKKTVNYHIHTWFLYLLHLYSACKDMRVNKCFKLICRWSQMILQRLHYLSSVLLFSSCFQKGGNMFSESVAHKIFEFASTFLKCPHFFVQF